MLNTPTPEISRPLLAVALIIKNEADNLGECLQSCQQLADEIVIVDSGSTDGCLDIARSFARVRIIEHHDWQGYGKQRRIAQRHVQARWVLWIDADERVTPKLASSIREAITRPDEQDQTVLYRVNRLSWVFGKFIRHSGWYPDRVIRLYRTDQTSYSEDAVHEHVEVPADAVIKDLEGDLLHFTYKDLHHYLVKSAYYAKLWADQRQSAGKKSSISQGIVHAIGCFLKMYIFKAGFLDGKQGLLLALLSAHSTFAKYADLWIRHQPKP